jgi:CarD family transcriptional regulator
MQLSIGQMVAYPNQGVCKVEDIERKSVGQHFVSFYALRVLSDNSMILVPLANAEAVGLRPVITRSEYCRLIETLSEDFGDVSADWKARSKEFAEKLQSGDVFAAADVLKKLTFLSHEKRLSFREQNFLDKARFLIVSEIRCAGLASEEAIETEIDSLIDSACHKHVDAAAAVH